MEMVARAMLLLGLTGCGFQLSLTSDDGGVVVVDVAPLTDAPPIECAAWDARHFTPCAFDEPSPPIDLDSTHSPYTYDTTTSGGELRDSANTLVFSSTATLTQSDSSIIAVMNVEGFRLQASAELRVIGTKPLLIASWDRIEIAGVLDAGSHIGELDATNFIWATTRTGAGANRDCANHVGAAGTDALVTGGSGGGGGGGFSGIGGDGSGGDNCAMNCPRPGGPGGALFPTAPAVIRGGCNGGASGKAGSGASAPSNEQTVAAAGGGGGAIELAARTSITITGKVLAGGAGGAGSQRGAATGGGGGGSGGYIGLDSAMVTISGTVAANGGGGGGSGPFAMRGWPGEDGGASAARALGGDGGLLHGQTCGIAGASGGSLLVGGTDASGNDACGGGGGGGGAGFVLAFATADTTSAVISPALTLVP